MIRGARENDLHDLIIHVRDECGQRGREAAERICFGINLRRHLPVNKRVSVRGRGSVCACVAGECEVGVSAGTNFTVDKGRDLFGESVCCDSNESAGIICGCGIAMVISTIKDTALQLVYPYMREGM